MEGNDQDSIDVGSAMAIVAVRVRVWGRATKKTPGENWSRRAFGFSAAV